VATGYPNRRMASCLRGRRIVFVTSPYARLAGDAFRPRRPAASTALKEPTSLWVVPLQSAGRRRFAHHEGFPSCAHISENQHPGMGCTPLQQDGNIQGDPGSAVASEAPAISIASSAQLVLNFIQSADESFPNPFASKFSNEICRYPPSSLPLDAAGRFPTQSDLESVPRFHPAFRLLALKLLKSSSAGFDKWWQDSREMACFKKSAYLKQAGEAGVKIRSKRQVPTATSLTTLASGH